VQARPSARRLGSGRALALVASGAAAAAVYATTRASGAYFPTVWPLLGAALALAVVALLLVGLRPGRAPLAAAAALVALGAWSLLSVAWGGLPDVAWKDFDAWIIAAAALLAGSLAARVVPPELVLAVIEIESRFDRFAVLYRLQAGAVPADWFLGRKVQGQVGYANAQGALLVVGAVLALWTSSHRRAPVRFLGGASAALFAACLLLTQSRGALLVLAVAILVQTAVARDLRVLALAVATGFACALVWEPLRRVDDALVDGGTGAQVSAFRHYAAWTLVAALFVGLAAATPLRPVVRRTVVGALLAAAVVTGAAAGIAKGSDVAHAVRVGIHGTPLSQEPQNLPGGTTRLTSLASSGRVQLWRQAWRTFSDEPAHGSGRGTFSRIWTVARTDLNAYVLQPHSIELELLSELGVPGFAAFAVFVVAGAVALVGAARRAPAVAGAAAAAFAVLVVQGSYDWTFSFPALVATVLFLLGLAAGGRRAETVGPVFAGVSLLALLLVLVMLGGPYLSARALAASRASTDDLQRAWDRAADARRYDRWSAEVVGWQASVAESAGRYRLAAALDARAAELAQQPWTYEFRRARVLRKAGLDAERKQACLDARAANPLEWRLQTGPCTGIPRTPVP